MWRTLWYNRFSWLAVGLIGGLMASGFWPSTPLQAVSTDRFDTFAIATGPVDNDVEAIYFLDFLTGDLKAAVLGSQGNGFTALYEYNVLDDLKVTAGKTPHFLMVTGIVNIRRGSGRSRPAAAAVYVAEANTGIVAAYSIPWARDNYNSGQLIRTSLVRLASMPFRRADVVRPGATSK